MKLISHSVTLPETNIVPENRPSQKETSIPTIHFWVSMLDFRGVISLLLSKGCKE